ncbi:DUF4350 domain-containing protein [Flavobacterium beibuense]|uniref:DUF4350 domain-containing protein n=1 Tax=Flavobacterium beibuense TaxID=657326 RepID=A0A444W7I1_9FLAO|nr:DUF4350 domain-containing protein [Flavobacterium beibuense]RYJ41847.1 hypothetical protein NU09_2772 [Flavobacterium beibuense]
MKKPIIICSVLLVIVITLIIWAENAGPKSIDWTPSYQTNEKIPLGLYVMNKESKTLFKNNKVTKFSETPYEFLNALYDYDVSDYTETGTFINIEGYNSIDIESAQELLYFAEYGNTVFLSMKDFPEVILDSLKIGTSSGYHKRDSIPLTFANKKLSYKTQSLSEGISFFHFNKIDTLNTTVLGYQEVNETTKQANFIKVAYGNGYFILHTQPAVFTNFHLLRGKHYTYAENVISYLPQENIYWYSHSFFNNGQSNSIIRYILSQQPLKNAYYLSLLGILIFMIFNARRKQRIVPIVPPVKNTTIDFTKTIGNLYFQERNHHTIIDKKIIYFLEHIRTVYLIDTYSLDSTFVEKLHQKTGKPVEDIEKAVSLIKRHRHNFDSTEADLIEINKAIENLRL